MSCLEKMQIYLVDVKRTLEKKEKLKYHWEPSFETCFTSLFSHNVWSQSNSKWFIVALFLFATRSISVTAILFLRAKKCCTVLLVGWSIKERKNWKGGTTNPLTFIFLDNFHFSWLLRNKECSSNKTLSNLFTQIFGHYIAR